MTPSVELLRGHLYGVAYRDLADLLKGGGWPDEVPDEPVIATARIHRTTLTLSLAPASSECPAVPAPPVPNLLPYLLSPLETQVVREILRGGPGKQIVLARRLGMLDGSKQANPEIRYLLPNLVSRSILEDSEDGYRLTAPFASLTEQLPQLKL